jgi:hypothetical protein
MRRPLADERRRPGIAPGKDMPPCLPEARRRGIEDVLAHWNPGYIPVYGIPVHLILGLREGLVRERDDEARGLPHEPAPRPIARRLRTLFRRRFRAAAPVTCYVARAEVP